MKLIRSYKVRLLPNKIQEQKLKEYSGVQRFIYNNMLFYCMDCYDQSSDYIHEKDIYICFKQFTKLITTARKTQEYKWLKDISRHTIMNIQRDLQNAYEKFFKFQNTDEFKYEFNKDKYQYKCHPKYKCKKDNKISIPFDANDVYYDGEGCIQFPKIGHIKIQTNLNIPIGKSANTKNHKKYILNPRIKFINNKWILCFAMEIENQNIQLNNNLVIGIDLGIKELCVATNINNQIKIFHNINKTNKRIKRLEKKLNYLYKSISRKYRTFKRLFPNQKFIRSNSFMKVVKEIQKTYYWLTNIRKNYLHHVSREIVNQLPEIIVLEDLDLQFMIKNHKLAKYESNQCLGLFRQMIKYKAEELGIEVILADKTYPSTQLCSHCGSRHPMSLSDRTYICPNCNIFIDRDVNAAINLELYGLDFLKS